MVYFALCQSLLLYGIILVWENRHEIILRRLCYKNYFKDASKIWHSGLYDEFKVLNLRQLLILNLCINLYKMNCTNLYPTRIFNRTNIILPRFKTELYSRHAQSFGQRMAIKYRYNYD